MTALSAARAPLASVRASLARAPAIERACYAIGLALIANGLVALAILIGSGGTWAGPVSWRKPTTFGLSFGLTLISIAWVASSLPLGERRRRWLLGAFAAACVAEVALITMQAWRHVPSHFNMETTVDATVSRALAAGGGVLIVVIAALTVAAFRRAPEVAPSMRLALCAGFLALDVALAIGAVTVALAVLDVAGGDQQAAYGVGAHWKPAHAVPMHGVLALPLLAWLLARTALPEPARLRIVVLAVAGYAVLCTLAVIESAAGVDPFAAPLPATLVALVAVLAIAVAATRTLLALRRRRA
jgi:hypothetical protein